MRFRVGRPYRTPDVACGQPFAADTLWSVGGGFQTENRDFSLIVQFSDGTAGRLTEGCLQNTAI